MRGAAWVLLPIFFRGVAIRLQVSNGAGCGELGHCGFGVQFAPCIRSVGIFVHIFATCLQPTPPQSTTRRTVACYCLTSCCNTPPERLAACTTFHLFFPFTFIKPKPHELPTFLRIAAGAGLSNSPRPPYGPHLGRPPRFVCMA